MLEHLIEFAIRLGTSVLRKNERVPTVLPPNPSRVRAMQGAYRTWAERHGLQVDGLARTYRGRLDRHDIVVAPGLDGSTASSVEVATTIEHGQSTAILLKAATEGATDLEKSLTPLFADPTFGRSLRSIAVHGEGLRIRFRALTSPELVEGCVLAAVEAVEHARPRTGGDPYR